MHTCCKMNVRKEKIRASVLYSLRSFCLSAMYTRHISQSVGRFPNYATPETVDCVSTTAIY